MLTILDLEKILSGNEDQVGGFDLICRGNVIKKPDNYTYGTMLGTLNNREKQLKTLSKQTANRLAQLHMQKNLNVGNPYNNNQLNNNGNSGGSSQNLNKQIENSKDNANNLRAKQISYSNNLLMNNN